MRRDWDKTEMRPRQNWDKTEKRMRQARDKTETRSRLDRDKTRPRLMKFWKYWTVESLLRLIDMLRKSWSHLCLISVLTSFFPVHTFSTDEANVPKVLASSLSKLSLEKFLSCSYKWTNETNSPKVLVTALTSLDCRDLHA